MELLNPPIPNTPQVFSGISVFGPQISFRTYRERTHRFHTSKFNRSATLARRLTLSNTKPFHVSAHFGRPTSRRNSLRKKLLDDQKVRQYPIPLDPTFDSRNPNDCFDGIESFEKCSSSVSARDIDVKTVVESGNVEELKSRRLGDSVLLTKLENWVDQFKTDAEFWGIGSDPIFTVLQDLEGNVKQVKVDEDEILKRSRVHGRKLGDLTETNSKILHAKKLAQEMEMGKKVIPRNSSVAKFAVAGQESGLVSTPTRGVTLPAEFIPKVSKIGKLVFFGVLAFWVVKMFFPFRNKEVEYTELEKEMMRRKIRSRKAEKMLEKGSVEVVQESSEPPSVSFPRPKLDKQELVNSIWKAKTATDKLPLLDFSSSQMSETTNYDHKIQEIRAMSRQVKEIESRERSMLGKDDKEGQGESRESFEEMEVTNKDGMEGVSSLSNIVNGDSRQGMGNNGDVVLKSVPLESGGSDIEYLNDVASLKNRVRQPSNISSVEVSEDWESTTVDLQDTNSSLPNIVKRAVIQSSDAPDSGSCLLKNTSNQKKPRVILSVKEAREFLSSKCGKQEPKQEPLIESVQQSVANLRLSSEKEAGRITEDILDVDSTVLQPVISSKASKSTPTKSACESSTLKDKKSILTEKRDEEDSEGANTNQILFSGDQSNSISTETVSSAKMESWIEKNFNEVEPVLKKIGEGFRDSYMVAREKVHEGLNRNMGITELGFNEDESELDWMKDDKLREIVFQVRENELAGRDPFYLMDAEDKLAFFQGLEKKVGKENEKLSILHEWLHSNIENLDYGADGISLYDPPEKVIPRWKGPPLEKSPEFLNNFLEQRKALFPEKAGMPHTLKKDEDKALQKSAEFTGDQNFVISSAERELKKELHKDPKDYKTLIEGSDGSVRSGKKSAKEYWQHTKKWSRGFLESYNAETDPEAKSIMKDIGKDLDRWITDKEIQEAADLMDKLPERNKKFMEKKLNKLKREMELFGPQAVVCKYREYAEDKEEDYLWWLDLPHVLCIELYTIENGEQRIGFYALEMAADLELEPKPQHVITFEDAGDCRNFCYIIQAHMDMLGNGNALIVPRPPKDAFREAKANGFNVTVIRKGELQLNADQTLEEVEEQIAEIGSKIYHDMITRERSLDISALMKGVFGVNSKPSRRKKLKKRLKKPSKK